MFVQQTGAAADTEELSPDAAVTTDGVRIRVLLNISDLVEADDIRVPPP